MTKAIAPKKVYIVIEFAEGEKSVTGVYYLLADARNHARDVAEYASLEPTGKDVWGDDEFGIRIQAFDVE